MFSFPNRVWGVFSRVLFILGVAMLMVIYFKPRARISFTPDERLAATGNLEDLPEKFRKVFVPNEDFVLIPKPAPGDWLAMFPEPGQTFGDYRRSKPNSFEAPRNKIYLLPIGAFPLKTSPSLDLLSEFTSLYFVAETKVLSALDLQALTITHRTNQHTQKQQYLTGDLLNIIKKNLPNDGYCILGITMEDLYPGPAWNFVFGEATLTDRAGVFSFARYAPTNLGEPGNTDSLKLVLKRSCKVLAHETAHMFGLFHCVFYSCLINGSNHLMESDSRPMHECPVCLRKLQSTIGFDPIDRYRAMLEFCRKNGFDDETSWLTRHLKFLSQN